MDGMLSSCSRRRQRTTGSSWTQKGIDATDDRRFDFSLIIDALGSFEGFLFDELRNKKGWCYGAYAFVVPATSRPGRIGAYADPSLETSKELIPELLRSDARFSGGRGFSGKTGQRNATFKNRYSYQLDLKFRLASRVSRDRYGIPILEREAYNSRIDAVTDISARRVIDELFDDRNLCMVFYGDAERIQKILADVRPVRSVHGNAKRHIDSINPLRNSVNLRVAPCNKILHREAQGRHKESWKKLRLNFAPIARDFFKKST